MDRGFQPDVGEIGDGENVHHAPGLVGGIALQFAADRLAHGASGAVATDHVTRRHRLHLALVAGIEPFEADGHGMARAVRLIDGQINETTGIIRLQPVRRVAHDVEIEVVHAGLIEDHMGKFGKPVLGVLDPAVADDRLPALVVRLPEGRLVDEIGFPQDPVGETEGVEHFHRAAGDAVGLAKRDRAGTLLDDADADAGESAKLGSERQPGRPGADDQHIDFAGGCCVLDKRLGNRRIAGAETVLMKLHDVSPPQTSEAGNRPPRPSRHPPRPTLPVGRSI